MRPLIVLAVVAAVMALPTQAFAGYVIQPFPGATTGASPTFLVYLDSADSLAEVQVASTSEMTSFSSPVHPLGYCSPTTSFGEPNKYTCQPSYYSTASFTDSLPPGTYYWSMSFYRQDPGQPYATPHISGPFPFTVAEPTPPVGAGLVTPADTATVGLPLTLTVHAPGSATVHFYVSDDPTMNDDGTPVGSTLAECDIETSVEGDYDCTDDGSLLDAGSTYNWWVVIDTADGGSWIYDPRSFTVKAASGGSGGSSGGGGAGGGGGGVPAPNLRDLTDAPTLPSSPHFKGRSVKQSRLSASAYKLTKVLGLPTRIAVGCWSPPDWANVSGDSGDGVYSTLGFYTGLMPHWVQLSPRVCGSLETLLYHRPAYPNRFTANAVETLTHEMMHALGVRGQSDSEAKAECFGMQLSITMAYELGVPAHYGARLAHLTLENYSSRPARYRNYSRCRENGAWDLYKGLNSPPWHDFQV
jgi:hypothetical protein